MKKQKTHEGLDDNKHRHGLGAIRAFPGEFGRRAHRAGGLLAVLALAACSPANGAVNIHTSSDDVGSVHTLEAVAGCRDGNLQIGFDGSSSIYYCNGGPIGHQAVAFFEMGGFDDQQDLPEGAWDITIEYTIPANVSGGDATAIQTQHGPNTRVRLGSDARIVGVTASSIGELVLEA